MIYDFIIIGSGISGLYTFYRLKKKFKSANIILLEKNDYIGGRAQCVDFHGTIISLGAGIIRPTDKHILTLCKKLGLKVGSFEKSTQNAIGNLSARKKEKLNYIVYQTYLNHYEYIQKHKLNFIQFLNSYFDTVFVNYFINHSEYTDYIEADVQKTIEEYPMEEILLTNQPRKMMYIDGNWISLIDKLVQFIGRENVSLNQEIYCVTVTDTNKIKIKTKTQNSLWCKQLFVCADKSIENIHFINCGKISNILENIGSVPFTRVYAYFKDKTPVSESCKDPLSWHDKIIPINDNVTMIAYNDSEKATFTNKIVNSSCTKLLSKMTNMKIDDFVCKYWQHGVHYFKKNVEIKNSWSDKIIFLGEMVSKNQGFVEGCIQSVDDFFNCDISLFVGIF